VTKVRGAPYLRQGFTSQSAESRDPNCRSRRR
jgi:hypothetical protein